MSTPRLDRRTAVRPSFREAVVVLGVLGLVMLAVFATYARLPGDELYRTTQNGLSGGARKVLAFLNFPVALVALAVLALAVDRLLPRAPRAVIASALVAAALCLAVVVPGASPHDVDAKPINVLRAVGVLIVLALMAWSLRVDGVGTAAGRVRDDAVRLGAAILLVLWSLPWLFAEVGFFAPWPFLSDVVPPGEIDPAVHVGRHHGMDGTLLALSALALSRQVAGFRSHRLASVAAGYLSVMLTYGIANAAQDGWLEQVVKRGWTDAELPYVIEPSRSLGWAVILLAAGLVYRFWFRPEPSEAPRADVPSLLTYGLLTSRAHPLAHAAGREWAYDSRKGDET